jgi:RNA polymerase-binding protein DksA
MSETEFSEKEIEHFKQKLFSKRQELLGVRDELQNEALRKSSKSDKTGDLSDMPIHMADVGSDAFEQELNLAMIERERQLISEIDDALRKTDDHRYGVCEMDGRAISRQRLEVIPWTRYCVECEFKREKGT